MTLKETITEAVSSPKLGSWAAGQQVPSGRGIREQQLQSAAEMIRHTENWFCVSLGRVQSKHRVTSWLIKWCWVEDYQEDKAGGDSADRENQLVKDQGNEKSMGMF